MFREAAPDGEDHTSSVMGYISKSIKTNHHYISNQKPRLKDAQCPTCPPLPDALNSFYTSFETSNTTPTSSFTLSLDGPCGKLTPAKLQALTGTQAGSSGTVHISSQSY